MCTYYGEIVTINREFEMSVNSHVDQSDAIFLSRFKDGFEFLTTTDTVRI